KRLIILSRDTRLYSTRRLAEAARRQGHRIRILDPTRCYLSVATGNPAVYFRGRDIRGIDGILPRIGTSITGYGTSVLRQFEILQVTVQNSSDAILRTRNKLHMLQRLAASGIPVPQTGMAFAPEDNPALLRLFPPPPLIIKLIEGSQGLGVVLAENPEAAESVTETLRTLMAHFLVQHYVTESRGRDRRLFVMGTEVVASMERTNRNGGFRANLHRGGHARSIRPSRVEIDLATRAVRVLGLDVAGVDLLETETGPVVLEVNAAPGLEGIEQATGVDIATRMIDALVERIRNTSPMA
ncbi:alpha-L-glutamate ligase, RimK family, partial [mine drainage metagenome]